jgi:hypothetical protein
MRRLPAYMARVRTVLAMRPIAYQPEKLADAANDAFSKCDSRGWRNHRESSRMITPAPRLGQYGSEGHCRLQRPLLLPGATPVARAGYQTDNDTGDCLGLNT